MAAVAPSEPTDPELHATAWDLEPLVEGEGPDGVERRLSDALDPAHRRSPRSYAGKLGSLDASGLQRGDAASWRSSTS